MFKNLNYEEYLLKFPFYKKLGINDIKDYGKLDRKNIVNDPYHNVNPTPTQAFHTELDDLIRLHYLITTRKVTTILEFGLGKSTIVFDDALEHNKAKYSEFVSKNLRRTNAFLCYSVDDDEKWIENTKKIYKTNNVIFNYSPTTISTFNDRICTYYEKIPNICPDFIYLDGPGIYKTKGDIRGFSMSHQDRLPMAADILAMEHFLLPGALIVVDGRTANARFLKANFQRKWHYIYNKSYDQHFFELKEESLGMWNERQINFCLKKRGGGVIPLCA
ncbi:hypothetical protein [Helicobacter sp.]|uniref:hypothetical protein n=1 Tax=Helicobacter sp. TaxID=218 RepID=UPI0019B61100|nr:hypothetical protein [Helicobacter sp.]MBD5164961.1 hypothetical protein [Helicobacter sp.]